MKNLKLFSAQIPFSLFSFFSILILSTGAIGMEKENGRYSFAQNFELVSASAVGQKVIIKLKHPKTFGDASFYFSPKDACKESYPPQCEGTVLRLDQGPDLQEWTTSTLAIWPEKIYPYPSPMFIDIKGPHKILRVSY